MYPFDEQDFAIADRVRETAERREVKPVQVALSWVLQQQGITSPIVGTGKIEHLEEMAAAVELELTNEELGYLAECYRPREISGHE